jgi:hypothetical protein
MLLFVKRGLPQRPLVVVADSSYATLELLHAVREAVAVVTRWRLEAALSGPAAVRQPGHMGRPRKKGPRWPTLHQVLEAPQTAWQQVQIASWYEQGPRTLERSTGPAVWYHAGVPAVPMRWVVARDPQGKCDAQAFLCPDLDVPAPQRLAWVVQRWHVEGTFAEARAPLGIETQRQWSDKALARTTPALVGLYALMPLFARQLIDAGQLPTRSAAWYPKQQATFSDTIALVRRHLWSGQYFARSQDNSEMLKVPRAW